jgi:AcrR family transcriptional regulator
VSRKPTGTTRPVGEHFEGDLRRALIDAAIDGLADVGADHLSLRDVARRAGVSHAAPAHHFGDKAGLLTVVATEGFELFAVHLSAAAEPVGTEPATQLASLGRAYAEFAERHPAHFEVMFRPGLIRADDPAFTAAGDAAFALLRSYIEECQRAGWRPDADTGDLTVAAWSLAHGVAVLRQQGSLARHLPEDSLDAVVAIAASILEPTD